MTSARSLAVTSNEKLLCGLADIPQLQRPVANQLIGSFYRHLQGYGASGYAVEDVRARTKEGSVGWNKNFSPLEAGKRWMCAQLAQLGTLSIKQGYETAELRKRFGMVKGTDKTALCFAPHNVDSWVLAKDALGVESGRRRPATGHIKVQFNIRPEINRMIDLGAAREEITRSQYIENKFKITYLGSIVEIWSGSKINFFPLGSNTTTKDAFIRS